MSEQKMPALPAFNIDTGTRLGPRIRGYSLDMVERIRAEAVEFGRQQERERMEPLRVAMAEFDAADRGPDADGYIEAKYAVIATARTLLEQTP